MKAFPVSVEEIFALNRNNQDGYNFNQQIKKLVIPMYQREYKWQEDKVVGLVEDIIANKKFLGNILLDELLEENNNRYEIVDGQQRLTTAMLIVIAVYNLYGESESVDDQNDLISRFKHNNEFTLQNQTIGNFVVERARDATHKFLDISINDALDIYCQKKSFNDAYGWIINKLKKEPPINIEDFLLNFMIASLL